MREHIAFRVLWLLMGLHILNYSVDSPDKQPNYVPEDLSYNDMESIAEIVLEQFLDIDDAMAEHDEDDDESGSSFSKKRTFDVFVCHKFIKVVIGCPCYRDITFLSTYTEQFFEQFNAEIIPPPPKA
ncbi:hypothetical protein [Flexibacter flexilis]|nr:hypothetical protein [Flexibacter flexilis]